MCSVGILADVLDVLVGSGLRYRGTVAWLLDQRSATQHWPRRCFERWKPVVVMTKGSWADAPWYSERHLSEGADKELHPWQQSLTGFTKLVRWFSRPGELVATPFCGSGTVGVAALAAGRRWTGCDIDPKAVEVTRTRLADSDFVAPAIIR
jgi:DNA modification methylase